MKLYILGPVLEFTWGVGDIPHTRNYILGTKITKMTKI